MLEWNLMLRYTTSQHRTFIINNEIQKDFADTCRYYWLDKCRKDEKLKRMIEKMEISVIYQKWRNFLDWLIKKKKYSTCQLSMKPICLSISLSAYNFIFKLYCSRKVRKKIYEAKIQSQKGYNRKFKNM